MDRVLLLRTNCVNDLGVIMSPSHSLHEHLAHAHITSRSIALIDFIIRTTRKFQSPQILVTLYKSTLYTTLVVISLNCSIIWNPFKLVHIEQLHMIQDRFLRIGLPLPRNYSIRLGCSLGSITTVLRVWVDGRINTTVHLCRRKLNVSLQTYKWTPGLISNVDFARPRETRSKTAFPRRFSPTGEHWNLLSPENKERS